MVTNNGLKGDGAGVLFANAGPGTASYDNLVQGNYIAGNGLSGVTMHAHIVGKGQFEDLNGNVIIANSIGKNNIDGDPLDGVPGTSDPHTTGVLVYSAERGSRRHRVQSHIQQHYGIWLSKAVKASGLRTNVFTKVNIPVSGNH